MQKLTVVWALLAIAITGGAEAAPVFNPVTGHFYDVDGPSIWSAAEAAAVALGGHLVTVNDAAEHAFLFANFPANAGNNFELFWIGLNDIAVEGTFVWTSGEPVTFTSWAPGEPNNGGGGGEDVVVTNWSFGAPPGLWNDFGNDGDASLRGIVELPQLPDGIVPAPASLVILGLGLAIVGLARRIARP